MSNVQTLNDEVFLEAFNIISSNKTKANILRQNLLQNLSNENEPNSKIIGYLGELEYDLKSLYDILKDLQLSYHEIHNILIKSNINECINKEKKAIGKTYSITTEKNNKNCFDKINNYYINSPIKNDLNKTLPRSTSYNSFLYENNENKLIKNKYNYLNNLKEKHDNNNLGLSKGTSPKLNFDYDAYFTDYSLNKTVKNSFCNNFDFLNHNINKYNFKENRKENFDNNINKEINDNNNIKNKNNNNIFTFSEQKNNNNNDELNNNIIEKNNKNNSINYYTRKLEEKKKENNIPKTYEYHRKTKEEEELERQKKEIIKNIISDIFQDAKKLNLLKKALGEDIGEKLLSGNINEKELYKVVEILKKIQEKDYKKKKLFQRKKYNQPSDKILLREKLNNKRYNYREYPRGWSSTKDYFINNGTPLIKDKRYRKIK